MSILLNLLKPALRWYLNVQGKKALPRYNETVSLKGLHKKVEIFRDKWAVPHIYAENRRDVFFAQGYAHAQDRLWQMEVFRRLAGGRMSELFGKLALDTDRISRTMGFMRSAQSDLERVRDHEIMPFLQAYADGVNAFLANCKNLPPEFKLLRHRPEPWQPVDSLLIGRLIAFQLSVGFQHEIERMRMVEAVGLQKALELYPEYPSDNPAVLERGIETHHLRGDGRLEAFDGPFFQPLGASNNWAVAASKMQNGSAALCNDPHLLLNQPNIWYENHLSAPNYETTGVSIPGVPLVLIGHNRKIAWGCTVAFTDLQDTYIEKFTSDQCLQYQFGDRILRATHLEETIRIKGQKQPHIERVIVTHHGPVISDVVGVSTEKISLCSQALRDNDMILGFYELNLAEDWNSFVRACAKIEAPALNIVYADTQDNIGYYVTGKVPIRKLEEDFLPRRGWMTEYEWESFVPFEEMPHSYNPSLGYIFSCNNKIVDDSYPHYLGNLWMNGYRARRLQTLFRGQETYSQADFAKWQLDVYSYPGKEYAALYRNLAEQSDFEAKVKNERARWAIQQLVQWDGELSTDSLGGCLYQVFKQELIDVLLTEPVQRAFADKFRGKGHDPVVMKLHEFFGHDTTSVLRILQNPKSRWLEGTTAEAVMIRAAERAVAFLEKELGKDPKNWRWGKLHVMILKHPLGIQKPFDEIFNVGGFELYGDTDTLCQTAFTSGEHYGGSIMGASYRQLIDMGNFDNSKCIAPNGQSGNFQSPYYKDQTAPWLKGELKPMLWSRPLIEEQAKYKATLTP